MEHEGRWIHNGHHVDVWFVSHHNCSEDLKAAGCAVRHKKSVECYDYGGYRAVGTKQNSELIK